MADGRFCIPKPVNEPVRSYAPGTTERENLKKKIKELKSKEIEIKLVIGGKKVKTGMMADCRIPHDHNHLLGRYHKGGREQVEMAARAALKARETWADMEWYDRAAISLKAAELLAGNYRDTINAATMLCQSKNAYQAEVDSACELIDFWRFNAYFMQRIYEEQPESPQGIWNRVQYRPLEGFVFAVTPFNFTSIAGNLPTSPALMGNVVLWKPASSTVYSNHFLMQLWKEAGLPDGVINFIPGRGGQIGNPVLEHPALAGIHFTGSTSTFHAMWKTIGENIGKYHSYPKIVGETGGKDFIFVHSSADLAEVSTAIIRGAFEYQGQKCSAASRAYIPKSMWPRLKKKLLDEVGKIKMGGAEDFGNFMNAVIDRAAYNDITGFIKYAKKSKNGKIICGGGFSDKKGYFIDPTIIETKDPHFKTMEEEIFGPVLTVYTYDDKDYVKALKLCDATSPYALTGAIFAKEREAINLAERTLINAAGNFYINDKPTGAVVGQQPFGGARKSGTNDKAGSVLNLLRWVSPRTIKETFVPPKDWRYPFMDAE